MNNCDKDGYNSLDVNYEKEKDIIRKFESTPHAVTENCLDFVESIQVVRISTPKKISFKDECSKKVSFKDEVNIQKTEETESETEIEIEKIETEQEKTEDKVDQEDNQ